MYSLFSVLNFVLPPYRLHFAEIVSTALTSEQDLAYTRVISRDVRHGRYRRAYISP